MPLRSGKARTLSAISMAADLGRRIQSDHVELVAMYRRFTPLSTMARRLGLMKGYGVSERIARNAIEYALRGFPGGYRVAGYEGLIMDPDELKVIVSGYRKKTGKNLKRQKKGICGQSKEEQRKAAIAGAKAVGWIVFTKRETECALRLCTNPRFCYESGPHNRHRRALELHGVGRKTRVAFSQSGKGGGRVEAHETSCRNLV